MRPIYILGVGQTPVSKETDLSIRQLAAAAVHEAMADAGVERVGALYLGNMLSGMLSQQQHLGALVADAAGLRGIEAATAEAACSSGAAAVRWGVMAVASGLHDIVVVAGVEKMTHTDRYATTRALATASDWDSEGAKGHNFVSLNAVLMQEYIERYRINRSLFAPFAINAHKNALLNPNACFTKRSTCRPTSSPRWYTILCGCTTPRPSATARPRWCWRPATPWARPWPAGRRCG
jgi:acetyl-CoA C-acetyltransferase